MSHTPRIYVAGKGNKGSGAEASIFDLAGYDNAEWVTVFPRDIRPGQLSAQVGQVDALGENPAVGAVALLQSLNFSFGQAGFGHQFTGVLS